jgi:copper transport protein
MDGDGVQHDLERRSATDLARLGPGLRHAVEDLEQVPVRALVFVDGHGSGKASSGLPVPSRGVKRLAGLLAVAALVAPAAAQAHATLVRAEPDNGTVLQRAPKVVRLTFDDSVRRASGNEVVSNDSRASVLAGPPRVRGRELVLPLEGGLADGDYSVRWSIVSQDGHREQGVLAFGVGAGRASPRPVLDAATPLAGSTVVLRTLYLLGLLVGAGVAVFWLLARRTLGARLQRPIAHLLFFAMLALFLGGSGMVHDAVAGTRYALVLRIAVILSLAAGAAAALAPVYPRMLGAAAVIAIALILAPTLSGHALDRTQPRLLSVPVDLAHTLSAAIWFGGLVALVFALPRASADDGKRASIVARFSTVALASVCVLALTGLGRALTELGGVTEIWSTSYGRALMIKTALFVPLLVLGWLNRTRLLGAFARLRRSALVESVLLLAIVAVVGVLTELRPGDEATASTASSAPLQAARPAALPPRDAVVAAKQLGSLAVAVARTPGRAIVTILGPDGTGSQGLDVRIDGRRTTACGSGCYTAAAASDPALRIQVGNAATTIRVPERAPDASAELARITRAVRGSKSIVFDETLRSNPTNATTTRFTVVAPNRLSYVTRGGASAVVIGPRRWDRERPGSPYVESSQTPLDVTQPYWERPTNVHRVAPGVLTFLDRRIPGWFRLELGPQHPRALRMTAAAHFMVDRYVGFDVPARVSPPPSR